MAEVFCSEGSRIMIGPLRAEAVSGAYQIWMKDPEVLRFLANPKGDYSLSALVSFVKTMNESRNHYLFGIFIKEARRHIGNVKIGNVDLQKGIADIGIIIGEKSLWGQGYATETIRLAVDYGFKKLGLFQLNAGMLRENKGSFKAFLKAGFKEVDGSPGRMVEGQGFDGHMVSIEREGNL